MDAHTLPMTAMHSDNYSELDWHNSFGAMEAKATRDWFNQNDKRGLIIERSSLAGSGKWASKWLGDNWSSAESMGYSVFGVLAMN